MSVNKNYDIQKQLKRKEIEDNNNIIDNADAEVVEKKKVKENKNNVSSSKKNLKLTKQPTKKIKESDKNYKEKEDDREHEDKDDGVDKDDTENVNVDSKQLSSSSSSSSTSTSSSTSKPFNININNIKLNEKLLIDNGRVRFCTTFLSKDQTTFLYDHLSKELGLNFEHSKIKMYGKEIYIPRLQSWMAEADVTPSLFQKQPARDWSLPMLHLKNQLEALLNATFDYVLINYYRDGNDYIGYHSDGEAKKEGFDVIASLSLGTTRRFVMRNNKDKKEKVEYSLTDGCLLVMDRDTQSTWKHQVVKEPKVKTPRINLTFRRNNIVKKK